MIPHTFPTGNPVALWCRRCRTLFLSRYPPGLDTTDEERAESKECPSCHEQAQFPPTEGLTGDTEYA